GRLGASADIIGWRSSAERHHRCIDGFPRRVASGDLGVFRHRRISRGRPGAPGRTPKLRQRHCERLPTGRGGAMTVELSLMALAGALAACGVTPTLDAGPLRIL